MIKMEVLNKETVRMRYTALVKKGIISDEECNSYIENSEIDSCMLRKVDNFNEYFMPGTVLLSEKASYKLRIEYPIE